jgi:hypothetical protein
MANLHIVDARLDELSCTIVISESVFLSPLEGISSQARTDPMVVWSSRQGHEDIWDIESWSS